MNHHYTNGYDITFSPSGEILKVKKEGREINPDTMLKVHLKKEVREYLEMCREDLEREAMLIENDERN